MSDQQPHPLIPDKLWSSTDPAEWTEAFVAWAIATPDFTDEELRRVLSQWFAGALETGRHYGAKLALEAADPVPLRTIHPDGTITVEPTVIFSGECRHG
jgi:hypothetical protein